MCLSLYLWCIIKIFLSYFVSLWPTAEANMALHLHLFPCFCRWTQRISQASQRVLRGHTFAPQRAPFEPQRRRCDARYRLAPGLLCSALPVPRQPARCGWPQHLEVTWGDPRSQRDLSPTRLPRGLWYHVQAAASLGLRPPKPEAVLRGGFRFYRWAMNCPVGS